MHASANIKESVSQTYRTCQGSLLLDNEEDAAGLDADTKDLPNPTPPMIENAVLAFKDTTGPRFSSSLFCKYF